MAMTNIEMAKELVFLAQFDIDAMHAYSRAIPTIGTACIKDLLTRFQQDHERHVEQLSAVILALDANPPSCNMAFNGLLTEDLAACRSLPGEEAALYAMKLYEEVVTRMYGSSSELDFTPNIKELINENYQDEQVHLRFIKGVLAGRAWEKKNL